MFKIDDEEQGAKEKVLQEIMGIMDAESGKKISGLKKPAAVSLEMTSTKPDPSPEHEALETPDEEKTEHETGVEAQDEPSDDEKEMISALYRKWCQ